MQDPRLSRRGSREELERSSPASPAREPLENDCVGKEYPENEYVTDENGTFRIDAAHRLGDAPEPPATAASHERPDLLTEQFPASHSAGENLVEDRFFAQVDQIREYLANKQKELEQREQRLLTQLAQLDQEQRSVRMWITQSEDQLQEQQADLERRQAEVAQRESRCRRIEAEVEEQRIELLHERAETETRAERVAIAEQRINSDLESIRSAKEAEWESRRLEIEAEIQGQRRRLESEDQDFRAAHERLESELRQERQLLENRVRFQLEHLDKMRCEVEEQQREFLITQQGLLNRNYRERQQIDFRLAQLTRYRDLLELREQSLERSWESLHKTRAAFQDHCAEVQGRFDLEQRGQAREQELRQAEIQRQHQMLTAHAENLEARHQRLDELRLELETSHRQLLEMRVAVEESTAQLAQAIGETGARERIDIARRQISEFYHNSQQSLITQRQEIEQVRDTLGQQREQFLHERELMTEWVKERDDHLKLRDVSLRKGEEDLTSRETAWQKLREFWQSEKLQAERIIRDLLRQLEDQITRSELPPEATDFSPLDPRD